MNAIVQPERYTRRDQNGRHFHLEGILVINALRGSLQWQVVSN